MDGSQLIVKERDRQVLEEGWSPQHDDRHTQFELLSAAMAYICLVQGDEDGIRAFWPWDENWFKPSNAIHDLSKAGALIAAEIDRLQRLETPDNA